MTSPLSRASACRLALLNAQRGIAGVEPMIRLPQSCGCPIRQILGCAIGYRRIWVLQRRKDRPVNRG